MNIQVCLMIDAVSSFRPARHEAGEGRSASLRAWSLLKIWPKGPLIYSAAPCGTGRVAPKSSHLAMTPVIDFEARRVCTPCARSPTGMRAVEPRLERRPKIKKPLKYFTSRALNKSLAVTYFHMGTPTLSSALNGFTSEFEMGSGGSHSLWPPGKPVFPRAAHGWAAKMNDASH